MTNQTKVTDPLVTLATTRSLTSRLADQISALDHGATIGGTAAVNTPLINLAIVAATGTTGFVVIPPGMAYTEASLTIPDGVMLIVFSASGTVKYLFKDQGASLPVLKGGVVIKQQGNTGILLRADDFGVTAEPILLVQDETTGDVAAVQTKWVELEEISSDPTAPSANRARLYTTDDGSGNTQLAVRFATGSVIPLATEGKNSNLVGTATYDPGSLADGVGATTTVTVTGAALGDICLVSFSLDLQGITLTSYVSAANTVSVRFQNETTGTLDLASGTLKAVVIRNY